MDFSLSKEQEMIVESVKGFVKDEANVERFRELRTTEQVWDPKTWEQMGDYGWLGITFPEKFGGIDGSFVDLALILEQLGRGLSPEPIIASVVLAGELILREGSDEQQESLLPPMIDGKTSYAFAHTERQSRYNPVDVKTSATQEGDDYVLEGEKVWVLNGHAAEKIVVSARTSGDQLDDQGISLFVVDADAEGIERKVVHGMDGHRTAFVTLSGVRVPAANRLGAEGGAAASIRWVLDRAAAAACAEAQGCLQELFERTVQYLKEREQFGKKIGSFQALQHNAADMFAETELCRGTMILAAIRADENDRNVREADVSAAKAQLGTGGWFVQENAIQLHGGVAITDEYDVGLFFKRVRVLQGLFGDVDYHADRFQSLQGFTAGVA